MSSWLRFGSVSFLAVGALAACNGDAPAGTTKPPVPGDVNGASTAYAAAEPTPKLAPKPAAPKADAKPAGSVDPAMMNPADFVPKEYCLMPKLSICSAYGAKYERIGTVSQFCAALGGEKAGSCPEKDQVLRCMTPANVITSYYSTGENPYTKESAEAKCRDKNWLILP